MGGFDEFYKKNKGLIIGAAIGLFIGLLIITINFWRTLLLFICVFIGAVIGRNENIKNSIINFFDKILPFK